MLPPCYFCVAICVLLCPGFPGSCLPPCPCYESDVRLMPLLKCGNSPYLLFVCFRPYMPATLPIQPVTELRLLNGGRMESLRRRSVLTAALRPAAFQLPRLG